MLNVGNFLFLLSFLSLIAKLLLSQYVDLSELGLEFSDSSATYVYDFIILICCLAYFKYIDKVFLPVFYTFAVLLPTYSLSSYLHTQDVTNGIATTLRWFLPFFMLAHYASYLRRHPENFAKLSAIISLVIISCLFYGFFYFPMATNRFDGDNEGLWWPAYFNNLHTTCYVAAALFFLHYASYSYGKISKNITILFFLVIFMVITFGWGIRTVSLLLLIFAYSVLHVSYLGKLKNYNYFAIFVSSLFSVIWYIFYFDWDYYSRVTSGRLSMYEAKLQQLSENSFIQWLIGNGAGSDIIETSFWWGAKGAHSDLITSLVEGGVIFFTIFLYLHFLLYKTVRMTNARYLIIPILFSGIVSNGYLSRPIAMYILMLAFAGFYALAKVNKSGKVNLF